MNKEKKGRDMTQFYDKSPYTHRKIQKQRDNTQKKPPSTSITHRLRIDLGRSVEVTTACNEMLPYGQACNERRFNIQCSTYVKMNLTYVGRNELHPVRTE